jgi:hypothetical protein
MNKEEQNLNEAQKPKLGISGVISSYLCSISELGYKPKKVFYFPLKDKNGTPTDKSLKVVEGSSLHKKLLSDGTKLPICWIVEE